MACPLEVDNGLLEHVLFSVVHAEATNNVDLGGVVPVTLLVVVDCLEFIGLLLIKIAHFGENFGVTGDLSDQDIVPLQGLAAHTNQLVYMSDLIDNFVAVRNDCVQFFKGLERFVVVA